MSHILEGEHHGRDDAQDHEQHGQNAQETAAGSEVHLRGFKKKTQFYLVSYYYFECQC